MPDQSATATAQGPFAGFGAALGRAAGWGALVGAYEIAGAVAPVRYASWAGQVAGIALVVDALLATALAVPCFLLTLVTLRGARPRARATLAAVAAGLGLLAVVVTGESVLHAPVAALGLTLLGIAFARPRADVPALARVLPGAIAAAVGLGLIAGGHAFTLATIALVVGLVAAFVAVTWPRWAVGAGALALLVALGVPGSLALGASRATAHEASATRGPSVVLVTFDTTRADYLGCYGKEEAHTPTWDRFAREGVLFADVTAQANVTGPSHTTMLTGRFPPEHGALSNGEPLRHDVRAVSELLSRAGWSTGAFVSGFTLDDRMAGLAARFDWYDDDLFAWPIPHAATRVWFVDRLVRHLEARGADLERADRPAGEVVDAALAWLDEQDSERPFFLWAHFYDPHVPYEPPAPFDALDPELEGAERTHWYGLDTDERRALVESPERVRRMLSLYEGEIAYADAQLDRLWKALAERGRAGNALWILTADHGEGFGEHDYWFDHVWLYEAELRVPFVVRWPRAEHAGTRVEAPVRLVDLAPTIAAACRVDDPDTPFDGVDLGPLARGEPPEGAPLVPAFGRIEGEFGGYELGGLQTSVRRGDWKLIEFGEHWLDSQRVPTRQELYRLDVDPHEQNDLLTDPRATLPPELESLRERLSFWRSRSGSVEAPRDHTPEEIEALRELGYL